MEAERERLKREYQTEMERAQRKEVREHEERMV